MDEASEEVGEDDWVKEQRAIVEEYLGRQKIQDAHVGQSPAFSVYPYVALWAIESKRAAGSVGWWAISGDLPTDYISSNDGRHPREAIRAFSRIWLKVAACMIRGEKYPNYSIGKPEQWPELGDLLQRRAKILGEYADDDELWQE